MLIKLFNGDKFSMLQFSSSLNNDRIELFTPELHSQRRVLSNSKENNCGASQAQHTLRVSACEVLCSWLSQRTQPHQKEQSPQGSGCELLSSWLSCNHNRKSRVKQRFATDKILIQW